MSNSKKIYVKTWGCQMNVYDAERILEVVAPLGFSPIQEPQGADLIVLNTCHIREKATEKLFSQLGRLHEIQMKAEQEGRSVWIAVGGCVAQAEGPEIQKRAPYVDMVFGPQAYHKLPEMILQLSRSNKLVLDTDFPVEPKFDFLPERTSAHSLSAFLAIQEGCDKFCSYCVVPYTRGAEYTRPMKQVLQEAEQLASAGVREITLLGQNVNAYRDNNYGLADLIKALADNDKIARIRYMTSHPLNMTDDLIAAHRDVPKLMPFIHLPIQSGSDKILDAMNRKHTADDYIRIADKIREANPDIALSSDFIVGFPGETAKDFDATMRVVERVGYAQAFSFKYSRRAGTPAAAMKLQISERLKDERLETLQTLLRQQQDAFNAKSLGQKVSVLFETQGKKDGQIRGRTPYLQTVHVQGSDNLLGQVRDVTITEMAVNSFQGALVTP